MKKMWLLGICVAAVLCIASPMQTHAEESGDGFALECLER